MKIITLLLLSIVSTLAKGASSPPPFDLSIVPENRSKTTAGISSGPDSKRPFYVVLTNKTDSAQPIFETWNSWSYQTISFDITLPDERIVHIAKRAQIFTRNVASTYFILPNDHQVFPISLDQNWNGLPLYAEAGRTKIKIKAIYTVNPTSESKKQGVWEGSISSDNITVDLNHW